MKHRILELLGGWRRRSLIAGTLAVVAGGVFAISAMGVHNTGAFELEGNATNDPAVAGDDWDNVVARSWVPTAPRPAAWVPRTLRSRGYRSRTSTLRSSPAAARRTRRTSTSGRGRTAPAGCPTRTTCCTASPRATRSVHRTTGRVHPDRRPARCCSSARTASTTAVTLRRGSGSSRNKVGLGTNSIGGGTGFTGVHKSRRPAGDQRLQQRRHHVDDHRLRVGPTCRRRPATRSRANAGTPTSGFSRAPPTPTARGRRGRQFCGIVNPGTITMPVVVHGQEQYPTTEP